MPVTEMIVGVAAGLFMLTGFVFFLRLIQAWLTHRTIREAIARDSAIAPQLLESIDQRNPAERALGGDDRNGLVLIAIGIALIGMSLIVGDPEWERYGLGAALFPTLVGLALIGRHLWLSRQLERDVARNG